ncbi:hypothetical protein LOAG_07019 [Loa loa]|uniref:Uncharacterized protein n=1 Tax=Loa loa TaxID=7209 RepID=A0A1S0TWM5_LOALO|nr:hypothetical protein LOAG_07019 [Loa loa]EFO21468.1 hypothetical protein LOAG_07019 [Loa loa]
MNDIISHLKWIIAMLHFHVRAAIQQQMIPSISGMDELESFSLTAIQRVLSLFVIQTWLRGYSKWTVIRHRRIINKFIHEFIQEIHSCFLDPFNIQYDFDTIKC